MVSRASSTWTAVMRRWGISANAAVGSRNTAAISAPTSAATGLSELLISNGLLPCERDCGLPGVVVRFDAGEARRMYRSSHSFDCAEVYRHPRICSLRDEPGAARFSRRREMKQYKCHDGGL